MLCLNSKLIPNIQKFRISYNRERNFIPVRCGVCASCQQFKAAEWSFRAYKHFEDCCNRHGFVLFDSLTYRPQDVPRFKDYPEFESLPDSLNYMTFNGEHLTLFFKRLRKSLASLGFQSSKGLPCFSYFVSSEYGTDERYTHRPHYHVLFYVYVNIDPCLFSRLVADAWWYGRTDGLPYKPVEYVKSNVFRSVCVGGRRVCQYVSKYVMKDSAYMDIVNKRVYHVLFSMANGDIDVLNSIEFKDYRRHLKHIVSQFHRQSIGFGVSALDNIDEIDLFECGYFKMPNGKPTMFSRIPISTYFYRKICCELVTLPDGFKSWSVRSDKIHLVEIRNRNIRRNLVNNLHVTFVNNHINDLVDCNDLADYMLDYRGRSRASMCVDYTFAQRVRSADMFVYASSADFNHFGSRFVSSEYLGYNGSYVAPYGHFVSLADYYNHNTYYNDVYENLLSRIESSSLVRNDSIQRAHDLRQHLNHVYKSLSLF